MTIKSPFMPKRGGNQTVTAGVASASVTLTDKNKSVRFVNAGAGAPGGCRSVER